MENSKQKGEDDIKKETLHHKQQEICMTRAAYRQGRKFTAVKVYSVSSESQHLYVYGVPTINLRSELKSLFNKYGEIISLHVVPDQKVEIFTECYHIHYKRIQSARIAKRLVDTRSFYGGVLHVCYAPECETLEEATMKLIQRKRDVLVRLNKYNETLEKYSEENISHNNRNDLKIHNKRKQVEIDITSPYSEEDPILTHKKKQKKNAEETVLKYTSQSSDVNGGFFEGTNNSFRKKSNNLSLPFNKRTFSKDKVYGPQLPTSEHSFEYEPKLNTVSSTSNDEKIQESLEKCKLKNIRKLPNPVEKRIIFRSKILNKII